MCLSGANVMKRTLNTILACFCYVLVTFGQQTIEFSQYMLNLSGSNPAAVGNNGMINILGVFRTEYAGLENAPMTFDVGADIGFNIGKTRHGAGLRFYDNMAGLFTYQNVDLLYAYHIQLGKGLLSAGVSIDFTTLGFKKDKVKQVESEYHTSSDPSIDGAANDFKIDLDFGIIYTSDKWFAGASIYNILGPKYELSNTIMFEKTRNMRVMGGYNFSFYNPNYRLKVSSIVNTDFKTWGGSVNANLEYKSKYWGGLGYRFDEAVVFMAGIKVLDGLMIGYSFDLPTSKLIKSAGCHEVILSYSFKVDLAKRNKYKSIRYL